MKWKQPDWPRAREKVGRGKGSSRVYVVTYKLPGCRRETWGSWAPKYSKSRQLLASAVRGLNGPRTPDPSKQSLQG